MTAIRSTVEREGGTASIVNISSRLVPLGRKMGTAWGVAHAALFLHSAEARFITGVHLRVDGGIGLR